MVGGGTGAFIGYVHRVAARIDGDYELVAGALSSRPDVAIESGKNIGLAADRIYTSYEEMAARGIGAQGRHPGRRDRHAQPHATMARPRPSSRPASTSSATSR